MRFDHEKHVWFSIDRIASFHKERACRVNLANYPIDQCVSILENDEEHGFKLKILLPKLYDYTYNQNPERFGILNRIELESTGDKYTLPEKSSQLSTVSLSEPQMLTLRLSKIMTNTESSFDNNLLRLVIPLSTDPDLSSFSYKSLKINDSVVVAGLVEITMCNKQYHLFKYRNDDTKKNYLFIDSVEVDTLDEFISNTSSIITGLGFVTGNLYQDRYYYQSIKYEEYKRVENILFEKMEESSITNKKVFDPYEFRTFLEAVKNLPKNAPVDLAFPNAAFSNLCDTIKSNPTFARCCKLIVEGNETKHHLLRAAIYSIGIETISNLIYESNKDKINPITDKQVAKEVMDKMLELLVPYKDKISDYGIEILKAKIGAINSPTNSKKLLKPFEIFGIKLTKKDIEALDYRNDFLHGKSPYNVKDNEPEDLKLARIAAHLFSLLTTLILKFIGYGGHMVNYPAWIRINRNEPITEPPFKLI